MNKSWGGTTTVYYFKCSIFNKNYETYKEPGNYGQYTERKKQS